MNVLQTLPEFCAGGTDLSERRRSGISRGQIVDLIPTDTMTGIAWGPDGAARIGALVTIETLASDPRVRNAYPGFAAAAASLATPQIRSVGTLGGNLAQRSRCGYFRNPHLACLKKGDRICPARAGNHLYGVAFDLGPCVAPHPSTLAAALLAYDATVTTNERSGLTIGDLLSDGSDGAVDNTLKPGEHIIHVDIRAPRDGERAGYHRVISRTYAEWPLVEAIVRVVFAGQRFEFALHNRSCNSLPATPAFIPEKRARIVAERFLIPPFGGSNPPAQSRASRVVVFDHTLRTGDDAMREQLKIREVVPRVHNDYTEVRSPLCDFRVRENRRHSRGLGWRARVSGRQILEFQVWTGGLRRQSLVAIFQFPFRHA